jgi:hypothetical protein
MLRLDFVGVSHTYCYLVLTLYHTSTPTSLFSLVQEGGGIVCLGGTSKAFTVAKVVDDDDAYSYIFLNVGRAL